MTVVEVLTPICNLEILSEINEVNVLTLFNKVIVLPTTEPNIVTTDLDGGLAGDTLTETVDGGAPGTTEFDSFYVGGAP